MLIIGLSGAAESGKNTVADMMTEYCMMHDLSVDIHAFADPVKIMVERLDPYVKTEPRVFTRIRDLLEECDTTLTWSQKWDQIKSYPDVRRLLQRMGTDAARKTLGDDIWVDQMRRQLASSTADVFIIPDVRFPEEQNFVHEETGLNVYIHREQKNTLGHNATHVSETSLDDTKTDQVLNNVGSLNDLRHGTDTLMDHLVRGESLS